MMNVLAFTLAVSAESKMPPSPAMAADSMNTESFNLIRFWPERRRRRRAVLHGGEAAAVAAPAQGDEPDADEHEDARWRR